MLIARQKPDATNVAGLRTWNSLGRFVKRGEKGIFIIAPMVGKKRKEEDATAEADSKTNGESRLYGFRASMFSTYYLVICGRASARSLHAASATLESRLDSTKQIIPQILCPAQRVGLPVIAEVPFVLVDRHNEDPSADCHNRGWL